MRLLRNIRNWAWGQIIREVPEDDAFCAFDCCNTHCAEGEWKTCMRRLDRAAGILMPAKRPPSKAVAESMTLKNVTRRQGFCHQDKFGEN